MSDQSLEFHLSLGATEQECSPVDILAQHSELSRSLIKQAMSKGAVWRQRGKKVVPLRRDRKDCQGIDQLHFYYHPRILVEQPLAATLLKDLGDYSVWIKPRGMRTQGSRYADHCALIRVAEQHLDKPCRIVHRLDQEACGLILLAHNKTAARHLSELFAKHEINKRYHIIVQGNFPDETLENNAPLDEKNANSEYRKLRQYDDGISLVEATIKTGRKHQVRRHAALLGFPIIGDRRYNEFCKSQRAGNMDESNKEASNMDESNKEASNKGLNETTPLQLCAQSLSFLDHLGKQQHFEINSSDWLIDPV